MTHRTLRRSLGGGINGVAAEYFVCDQEEAVMLPSTYDFRDGSTLSVSIPGLIRVHAFFSSACQRLKP